MRGCRRPTPTQREPVLHPPQAVDGPLLEALAPLQATSGSVPMFPQHLTLFQRDVPELLEVAWKEGTLYVWDRMGARAGVVD